MNAPDPPAKLPSKVRLNLRMPGGPFQHEFVAPPEGVRPVRMLPVFRAITDELVRRSSRAVTKTGRTISCKAGCGACCRQIVPISETEARHLATLIDELPEPRRDAVLARFDDARQRLESADLWERLVAHASLDDDAAEQLALDVLHAGIPCPFLEDESCSIRRDRPLSCRELLVTSDARHCEDPTPETIVPVPIASHGSDALARIDPAPAGRNVYWMPLVLALDWVQDHPHDPHPPRSAVDHINTFLGLLVALQDDVQPEAQTAAARRAERNKRKRQRK